MHLARSLLIFLSAVLVVGCAPADSLVVETAPLQLDPSSQSLRILSPSDGAIVGSPMTLRFDLAVTDQAPSAIPLTIRSTLRDSVWRGNISRSGEFAWTGEVPLGSQEISIEGIDRQGATFSDTVRVLVRDVPLPECVILSPESDTTVQRGVDIQFEAFAQDFEGNPIQVFWRSSIEGALFLGTRFERRMVRQGEHLISIEGIDELGRTCSDEIVLFVE